MRTSRKEGCDDTAQFKSGRVRGEPWFSSCLRCAPRIIVCILCHLPDWPITRLSSTIIPTCLLYFLTVHAAQLSYPILTRQGLSEKTGKMIEKRSQSSEDVYEEAYSFNSELLVFPTQAATLTCHQILLDKRIMRQKLNLSPSIEIPLSQLTTLQPLKTTIPIIYVENILRAGESDTPLLATIQILRFSCKINAQCEILPRRRRTKI